MANKSVLLLFIWFLFSFQVNGQSVNDVAREIHLFNFDWKFHYGDAPNAHELIYNDTNWETLDLPHDFQINLPWDSSAGGARGFKEMGIGWYRKIFKADPSWKGKKILLDFEGIMLLGDVWVNGKMVGSTDYGYLGFETEISGFLKYDTENVIAVKASTGSKGGSRWYTGGGLYRDVHLIVKHNVSIARHGIFVTTPRISNNDADIKVQVELEGVKNKMYNLEIEVNLMSPDGIQVASARIPAPKGNKQQTVEVLMPLIKINHPKLWSCEMPNLYMAEVSLILDGKKVDMLKQQFGIRTLMFDKEFGFKLNGEKIFLKGISNHHDLGALGAAAFETAIARQMDQLKAFGFNHIRTSHNPYSPSFLKLADEKGILIVDELYDKWSNKSYWGGRKPWSDLWFEHIKEWIKRDRNHPSVILWSFGNELQMREDLAGYDTGDWGVTTYQMMKVVAHRYDSTRKTTVAMFPARAGGVGKSDPGFNTNIVPPELATVTDIASFNYRWMNYAEYLKHAPNMNIYQSEATTNELAAPYFGMDRQRMIGLAYWGAIAYWGESNGWPKKGWNYSFFDHTLAPNPQAYLIKSIFVQKPMVHIGVVGELSDTLSWNDIVVGKKDITSHWNRMKGQKYDVFTYTNAEEVELFLNGKSLGIKKNNIEVDKKNVIQWDQISYFHGKLLAIARNNGIEVARHELETTGKAIALEVVSENQNWIADGMSLQFLKVYAIDNKGRRVQTLNGREVTFDVKGAASLFAVDNGDHFSNELFGGNKRKLYNGFAMAILRSKRESGIVNVKIEAEGFKPIVLKFVTK